MNDMTPGPTAGTSAVVLFAFLAVSLAGVLLRPALPVDETRYLAVAWEMHLNGDWLVPTKNFAPYSDKPPLMFWAINLIWALTGVSDTAARMVGPGFAAVALWMTGRLARALWPEQPGIGTRAMVALVALPVFAVMAGLTMFDAALTVAVLLGLLGLVRAGRGDGRGRIVFGTALALGVLAKGPVIALHLLPVAFVLPLWHPARPSWRQSLAILGQGFAIGLVLVLFWLVPAAIDGGKDYRHAILWTQSAGRVSDSFAHARPVWFFATLLPLLAFPWLWVPGLWKASRKADRCDGGLRLCLIWALTALVVFSLISGKQLHYLFPELPAIALIVARLAAHAPVSLRLAVIPFAAGAVGIGLAGYGFLPPGAEISGLHPQSALTAASLLLVAVLWTALGVSGLSGGAILSLGLVLCADLVIGLTDLGQRYDTARIARAIASHQAQGVAWVGAAYSAEFNFAGRLSRPVDLPGEEGLPGWIAAHPDGAIIGPESRVAPGWAPDLRIPFRNTIYGVWIVSAE